MVEAFEETIKSPIRRKRKGDIKTAVISNEKVVVKIVDKVRNHGKTFAFHDNEGTNHRVAGKAFPSGFREFPDKG